MLIVGKDGVMIDEKRGIIASGPLFKQRNTMAYRVVLRSLQLNGPWEDRHPEYVVQFEGFPYWPSTKSPYFFEGIYTRTLREGIIAFGERVLRNAEYEPEIMEMQSHGRTREDSLVEDPDPVQRSGGDQSGGAGDDQQGRVAS